MTKIDIELDSNDLIKALSAKFKDPKDHELAELIVNAMINGQRGIELLSTTLLLGYQKEFLKEGDAILANIEYISMYKVNKEATLKDSKCCDQGRLRGIITDVNIYSSYPYKISYIVIDDIGEYIHGTSNTIKGSHFIMADEGSIDE